MAKITASGDRLRARFRRESDGAELVLTEKGRLLYKWRRGEGFTVEERGCTPARAAVLAGAKDMERVIGTGR